MSFARSISEALRRYWTKDQADARYYPRADIDGLVAAKAPLASPPLTGTPTAPTAAAGNNTTQLATTAFVAAAVLPKADSTAVGVALAQKVNVSDVGSLAAQDADSIDVSGGNISGTNVTDCAITNSTAALVGTPTAPTAGAGTNTTQIATTAFVHTELNLLVAGAGAAYDTLKELQDLIVNDESAVSALTIAVAGKLAKASNLSDLASAATARTNLGLGALAVLGISPTLNNLTTTFAATVGTTLTVLDPTTGLGGVAIHDSILNLAGGIVGLNPADPSVFALGLQVGGAGINGDTPGMVFDTTGDTAVTDLRTAQFRNLTVNTFGFELADGLFHTFGNADTHHRWAGDTKTDNSGTVHEHAAEVIFNKATATTVQTSTVSGGTGGVTITTSATTGTMLDVVAPSNFTFNGGNYIFRVRRGSTTHFSIDQGGNWVVGGALANNLANTFGTGNSPYTARFTVSGNNLAGGTHYPGILINATVNITGTPTGTVNIRDFVVDRTETSAAGVNGENCLIWAGVGGVAKFKVNNTGDIRTSGSLGVGNSAAATTLGTVVKKVQIFDAAGTSLGYIPVYDAIT